MHQLDDMLLICGSPRPGSSNLAAQRAVAALDLPGLVLVAAPEYAGGLPGSLKNLLDRTVAGGALYGRPVVWFDVAHPGRGAGARAQLATVLSYVGARIVAEASTHPPRCRTGDVVALEADAGPELQRAVVALFAVLRGSPSRGSA